MATNINVSLSSSEQVSPNFWTDPTSGIPYYLAVQTPEYKVNSLNALRNTPVSTSLAVSGQVVPGMLSNVATFKRDKVPTNTNQTNIQEVYDVYASVQGRDLGGVSADINKIDDAAAEGTEARQFHSGGRPDPEHEQLVPESGHRALCSPRSSSIC